MPEEAQEAQQEQAQEAPPQGGAPEGGDFNPAEWLQGLDQQRRSVIDEYAEFKARPLATENHGLKTELGRLKKAADPAIVARLGAEEQFVERLRQATVALYGSDVEEDLKDIDSIDGFATALRFLQKGRAQAQPAPAAPAANADPDTQKAWEEFLASRYGGQNGAAQNGDGPPRLQPTHRPPPGSDDEWFKDWGLGKIPATPDNVKRASEIAKSLGARR